MRPISLKRRQFPKVVIHHAVWLNFWSMLSLLDVKVRYETIRC